MKASATFISTLKEAPADAEIASHRLMMRAGFIKRLGAGIYNYMPLGLRVIRKVEAIIRDEMNRAGAIELLMPVVQPAELWQETGRFDKMGPELLRVKDRHDRDFIIQPTSEEVITDIARQELRSYKQLPKNFYHIQTKFRDERRPRFGVMRGREFTMKDAYSFDRDSKPAAAATTGHVRPTAHLRPHRPAVPRRGGRHRRHRRRRVAGIPGHRRHRRRRHRLLPHQRLRRQHRDGRGRGPAGRTRAPCAGAGQDAHAGQEHLRATWRTLLGLPLAQTVKSLVLATDETDDKGDIVKTTVWLLLVRGDHDLNEVKAGKLPGLKAASALPRWPRSRTTSAASRATWGPINMKKPVKVVADRTVAAMADFVCGANEADFHFTGVNWGRDLPEPDSVADIRNVVAGDPSPDGKGVLAIQRGIEVGHVFYLGTKYSEPMNATYLNETWQAAADGDGLLRHRRHAHPGRGHRAEPRRARHHLAGCHCAVCRGDLPHRLRPQRRGAGGGRPLHDEICRRWASTWCWTTAASARRDVRRLGTDRRAAARGALRPRPEGRHGGTAGPREASGHGGAMADVAALP
jgi:prolyl-tRNA synthetase